jgi:hypothetical protein
MVDWNTRLAVSYLEGGVATLITPIDQFSPTFTTNAEAMHSIEQTHIGVIYTPPALTFSMTVKAIGPAAAQLTALALKGVEFDIVLQEAEGDDWSFKTILLAKCVITSAAPTAATISGAPSATFSGFSRAASADPKTGEKVEVP